MRTILHKLKGRRLSTFLSPKMWLKGAKHLLDRRQADRKDKAICEAGDGVAPRPWFMVFDLTMRCNLRCKMCYLTDEARSGSPADELSLEQIKSILSKTGIKEINLVGGEVFIRKDLFDILEFFRDSGIHCPTITTNGTLLSSERAERIAPFLADGTVGSLTFSIDGPEEIHDEVRGKGMFQRTLKGMRNVLDAAAAQGKRLPNKFNVNIAVSEDNFRRFDEVADVVQDLNVGYIEVNHFMFHTPAEIRATLRLLDEADGSFLQSGVPETPKIDTQELVATLRRLSERASAHGIATGTRPWIREDLIGRTYSEKFWPKARCLSPYHMVRMQSDGIVYFCLNIRVPMGDLKTQDLDEVWNSPKFCRYRAILLKRGVLPLCKRCCRVDRL